MVANETKLVKQPAASTGGESRAGARDARLSRGQEGVMSRQQQTNWTRTAEHQAASSSISSRGYSGQVADSGNISFEDK